MSGLRDLSLAMLLGGALAGGVLLVLAALPRWGTAPLAMRIAPYVRHVVADERMPHGVLPTVAPSAALRQRLRGLLERGGEGTIGIRLAQAGQSLNVSRFRARRLAFALAGFACGGVLVVLLALAARLSPPALVLPLIGAAGGAMACDALLTSRARARLRRLEEELPTTLEFLALCLSAGEGLRDALVRVASVGSGEMAGELRGAVLAVQTGSPLAGALAAVSARLSSPPVTRAVDQIIAALERGSPLAEVMQAQAADARGDAKRELLERAGRKEIAMMLPVVFALLPLSVLFALFPGILLLQLGFG